MIGGAQPPRIEGRGAWGSATLGLRCRITTDRAEYEIGDAVRLLVEVWNVTDHPVALGLEPLIDVGQGRLSRQPAEVHLYARQSGEEGPGFHAAHQAAFPRGTATEARAVVIEPNGTFSEIVTLRPWGPNLSSAPAEPEPGRMTLTAALSQFLSPDIRRTRVKSEPLEIRVRQARVAARPPPGSPSQIAENSQPTLRAVVGAADWEWADPAGLLPERFPGLRYLSGPGDAGLSPKASWRKPVVLRDARTGVEVSVNCYRKRSPAKASPQGGSSVGSSPALPLLEPDYAYRALAFHGLQAAAASFVEGRSRRELLAFVQGERLFKVRCEGPASAERLRDHAQSVAEAIHAFGIQK
jgi:hypothetical protein